MSVAALSTVCTPLLAASCCVLPGCATCKLGLAGDALPSPPLWVRQPPSPSLRGPLSLIDRPVTCCAHPSPPCRWCLPVAILLAVTLAAPATASCAGICNDIPKPGGGSLKCQITPVTYSGHRGFTPASFTWVALLSESLETPVFRLSCPDQRRMRISPYCGVAGLFGLCWLRGRKLKCGLNAAWLLTHSPLS